MQMLTHNLKPFVAGETTIFPQGPAGKLEVLVSCPEKWEQPVIGVVCHPHPLYGGTMHNKVVYTLARVFKELDISSVRFNFRGVGASEGQYAAGLGETDDLIFLLNELKHLYPQHQIWLAGFSFGSFVATRAAHLVAVQQLVTVAPAVTHFDFADLTSPNCPWLIVQGDEDEVVASDKVFEFAEKHQDYLRLIKMTGAGHFFHGRLVELRQILIDYLRPQLP